MAFDKYTLAVFATLFNSANDLRYVFSEMPESSAFTILRLPFPPQEEFVGKTRVNSQIYNYKFICSIKAVIQEFYGGIQWTIPQTRLYELELEGGQRIFTNRPEYKTDEVDLTIFHTTAENFQLQQIDLSNIDTPSPTPSPLSPNK